MATEAAPSVERECPHCAHAMPAGAAVCGDCGAESPAWVWESNHWWWQDPDDPRVWFQLHETSGDWRRYGEPRARRAIRITLRALMGAIIGCALWLLLIPVALVIVYIVGGRRGDPIDTFDAAWAGPVFAIALLVLVLGGAISEGRRAANKRYWPGSSALRATPGLVRAGVGGVPHPPQPGVMLEVRATWSDASWLAPDGSGAARCRVVHDYR